MCGIPIATYDMDGMLAPKCNCIKGNEPEGILDKLGIFSQQSRYLKYNVNQHYYYRSILQYSFDLHFTLDIMIAQKMYTKNTKHLFRLINK